MPLNQSFNLGDSDTGISSIDRRSMGKKISALTRMVMKTGLVKTARNAQLVLLAIAVIAIIVMFIVGFGGSGEDKLLLPSEGGVVDDPEYEVRGLAP